MEGVSVCVTLRNRAQLFKYCLESLSRQNYDLDKVEICIADGFSTDGLLDVIDRYSDVFTFKYACSNRAKAYIPVLTNCPSADYNVLIKYLPTYDTVIKMDPEIVIKDDFLISEIVDGLQKDSDRMYNARAHFTEGDSWYINYDDVINLYRDHYMIVDGEPFSRSVFYFCSGFSRSNFITIGGVEELMGTGVGYDDTLFREVWKNNYGKYEYEIDAQVIHLWHQPSYQPPSLFELNRRKFELLKNNSISNSMCVQEQDGNLEIMKCDRVWGSPDMLSTIYTIKSGKIINTEKVTENSIDIHLPFGV